MRSAINFRDFGGSISRFGGHVRRDRLYRSGHLGALATPDIAALAAFDFAVIVDLRHAGQRRTDRSPWRDGNAIERDSGSIDAYLMSLGFDDDQAQDFGRDY